ncbi:MAG TPA: SpoIIE family protein phosphatase [Nonomuraea sp.]|nr:SpoIIE family protein phosphatase [Nonomuraea sp.]
MQSSQFASALDDVLVAAARDTGANFGAIYQLSEAEQLLLMHSQIGMPGEIVKPWTRIRLNGGIPVAAAARRRELIWVPDQQDLTRRFPATALALPYPFAAAAIPIVTNRHVWGSWALTWPPSHAPHLDAGELEIIERASKELAEIVRQAAEAGCPVRPPERLRTLVAPDGARPAVDAAGFLERLRDGCLSLDLQGRVTFASDSAERLLGLGGAGDNGADNRADNGADNRAGDGAGLRGRELWEAVSWLKDPVFEDRYRASLVSRQPTACTARSPDGRLLAFDLHPDASGVSVRITPAGADHPATRRWDKAGVGVPAEGRVFANFLHTAAALTRAVTVREVVDLVTDQLMLAWDVRATAILTAESGRIRVIGSYGYARDVLDRFDGRPLGSPTPATETMRTGEPAFFADWSELRRRFPDVERVDDMAAWAFLPLTFSEQLVGTLVLAFDRPHSFTAEECGTLSTLAGLLAQTLDRAKLYDVKDRLAHTLQTTLLPSHLPEMPGLELAARYVPAAHGVGVGGDFYDLIRITDTSAAAVIGDVQGHNMTAAALMGQVRTAIRAHTVTGASPGEVLAHTNRLLIDLDTDLFTSCLLVHFDLRLRTLCAASAGHPPPLLRPPNAAADVVDVPTGLLLGIDPDMDYPTLQTPFPPEAVLVLYTDGLVETPGGDLENAIEEVADRLTQGANEPLHQLADALLDQAPAPRTGQRADDIALLLLQHRAVQLAWPGADSAW